MTKKQIEAIKKKTEDYEKKFIELSLRTNKNDNPNRCNNKKTKRSKKKKNIVRPAFTSYKEYLKSPEWKEIRLRILKRANNKCEVCKTERAYQVHHKTYKHIFNERDNELVAICGTCHQDKHKILTDEQIEKRVNKLMEREGYL